MTALPLAARSIASPIAHLFSVPGPGQVIATFERSCYLDLNGRIVALVAPELLNGPLNVVLAHLPEKAMSRVSTTHRVRMSSGSLEIEDVLMVDLSRADVWNAQLAPLGHVDRNALQARLDVIKVVLDDASAESLADAASRPARASEGMDALYSALRHQDAETLAHAAERLVGFGQGLTPSGDDVLAGMLIAHHLVRPTAGLAVSDIVKEVAVGRTTRISIAYLEAASQGNAGEAWHAFARTLEGTHDGMRTATRRIMAFGETSGADMLTGFVLAAEALLAE